MSAAEVTGERSRARLGSGRGTGSETAIGSARAHRNPREAPGAGDPRPNARSSVYATLVFVI